MEPPHIHALDTSPHRGQKQGSGSGLLAEYKPFGGNVLNGEPYGPENLSENLESSYNKARITLVTKPDKDTTRQENYTPNP